MMEQGSSTYDSIIHKKAGGRLMLSDNGLIFHPSSSTTTSPIAWNIITKHQVSPASYPKSLLKLVLVDGRSSTYQFASRPELERIRKEITSRLQVYHTQQEQTQTQSASSTTATATPSSTNLSGSGNGNGKKRPHSETTTINTVLSYGNSTNGSFGELDATALAVTRSSLLAANPSLRSQHQYLVQETKTLTEDDFWNTHQDLLEEEYARISGMTRAGTSSLLQAHLQLLTGRVTLGVEEMRQIFILYPAVHKAYEEKVPLELSDEQFWRKYLESEYFHRDRGRIGAASRGGGNSQDNGNSKKSKMPSLEEQEARAAAVGTDDLFSRYDQVSCCITRLLLIYVDQPVQCNV
jgi:transcription initiation factor TFIIH subunit 1